MHKKLFLPLILYPCLLFASPILLSQNEPEEEIEELNAYDPFTDYIDFQDSESEEEDMAFFQTGRFLSIGLYAGGYRHFIFPSEKNRNTTNSFNYGAFIQNFANLHIATQFSYIGSVNSFFYTQEETLSQALTIYHHFGLEFRYYWNRRRLIRTLARLNPYISGGVMVNRRTSQKLTTISKKPITFSTNTGGLKGGLGMEYHLSTRFYLGLHAEYNFIFIKSDDECINPTNPLSCPPENMINAMFVLGRNF